EVRVDDCGDGRFIIRPGRTEDAEACAVDEEIDGAETPGCFDGAQGGLALRGVAGDVSTRSPRNADDERASSAQLLCDFQPEPARRSGDDGDHAWIVRLAQHEQLHAG